MKKTIFISLGALLLVIVIFTSVAYFKNQKNDDQGSVAGAQAVATSTSSTTASYFDDNATIMFFYSDLCGWCQKEEAVLSDLAKDGYKVKPMNVKDHPDYWNTYQISGTPTLIAKNGQKKTGYMEKDALKTWLDQNK